MSTKSIRERINEDGLRYAKKLPSTVARTFKNTRSCFVCSTHHPQSDGYMANLMGRTEFFCSQACREKIFKPKVVKAATPDAQV